MGSRVGPPLPKRNLFLGTCSLCFSFLYSFVFSFYRLISIPSRCCSFHSLKQMTRSVNYTVTFCWLSDCLLGTASHLSESEAKAVVFSMNRQSAPGPDGFGSSFYTAAWVTVRGQMMLGCRSNSTHKDSYI
jgi:hypothetical protein